MKGAYFEQKTFKTLSNIGLEVDLTPWVGILRPMTPRHVTKVRWDGHYINNYCQHIMAGFLAYFLNVRYQS